jgi:hypothetical protein
MFQKGVGVRLRLAVGLLNLTLLCVAGCGKPVGKVTGTVKFNNGAPAPAGTIVSFWTTDGKRSYPGTVTEDGSYSAPEAPIGEVKVTLTPPDPKMTPVKPKPTEKEKEKDKSGSKPAAHPTIPNKYKDQANTPLKTTVSRGDNTFDITIEPDEVRKDKTK